MTQWVRTRRWPGVRRGMQRGPETPAGTDIIVNGGFETDLGFWIDQGTDAGVTRTQSSEQAHSGMFSQKVVTDGSEAFQGAIHVLLSWTAGQSLGGRFWIHGTVGNEVRVVFFNTSTAGVSAIDTFTLGVTGWQEVVLEGVAVDSPVGSGYFIIDTGNNAQAVTWYIDDVRLYRTGVLANLVTNSGFEVDTTGWIQFQEGASTFVRVTGAGSHGGSAYAVLTVAGGAGFAQRAYDFAVNPLGSQTFNLSVWVKANNAAAEGATASLRLWGIGGAEADAIINANTLVLTSSYQELTVSGAIDESDRTAARLAIQITGATADGDEMAIDDVAAYPP